MVICSRKNYHHLNNDKNNLVLVLTKKREKNKFTFPIFDNEFLSPSKQLKIGPKYIYIFKSNMRTYAIKIPGVPCLVY